MDLREKLRDNLRADCYVHGEFERLDNRVDKLTEMVIELISQLHTSNRLATYQMQKLLGEEYD